jgi:hypothetical protein
MKDLPETKRGYQAEVYLALATVIQAITLAALGNEIVATLKDPQLPDSIWVIFTGLLSLQLCISFWYLLVRDFFFGYRVINLTAKNHLVVASSIFILGLLQFIAFQFLADPRLWLTLVLMGMGVVLLNAWYTSHNIEIIDKEGAREALQLEPRSNAFIILILIVFGCLILWYLVPGIDTAFFRVFTLGATGAALAVIDISAMHAFQKHLEVEL